MHERPLSEILEPLETACVRLRDGSQGIAVWEWDDRFAAVLAVVAAPADQEFLALLRVVMGNEWDHVDIRQSPEMVGRAAGVWGGLTTDQRFFALDPEVDPMLYAAWWPWGSRKKFSVRVSCLARGSAAVEADPQATIRRCFGI